MLFLYSAILRWWSKHILSNKPAAGHLWLLKCKLIKIKIQFLIIRLLEHISVGQDSAYRMCPSWSEALRDNTALILRTNKDQINRNSLLWPKLSNQILDSVTSHSFLQTINFCNVCRKRSFWQKHSRASSDLPDLSQSSAIKVIKSTQIQASLWVHTWPSTWPWAGHPIVLCLFPHLQNDGNHGSWELNELKHVRCLEQLELLTTPLGAQAGLTPWTS